MASASSLSSSSSTTLLQSSLLPSSRGNRVVFARHPNPFNLKLPLLSLAGCSSSAFLAFSRRPRSNDSTITPRKNKKNLSAKVSRDEEEDDDADEDAVEALFSMLEEDLKSGSPGDDVDGDDISEGDLDKFQRELEAALGVGGDDDDEVDVEADADEENYNEDKKNEEEEEERPLTLKNWQLRRLASALKTGRRKTSIKSLAAEVCLDRAVVLEFLRDPPPKLVMMAAALPDKPSIQTPVPESRPVETVPAEEVTVKPLKSGSRIKLPVHVMQQSWSAQKRLKKVQVDTLERVYRRTKRPTNAMISSIVLVTSLPRKRIVKWFEDKRAEEGVPNNRVAYHRSVPEAVSSS